MCGIAGFWPVHDRVDAGLGERMAATLHHRGPDAGDAWAEEGAGPVLAHRRLAIIDLSPQGRQPMHSRDGRWVIAFNGEIYNHHALRARLEREGAVVGWRGSSDTEVLLEACRAWGLKGALAAANGMFALAIWDRIDRVLWLARDRLGEKPLYYGRVGDGLGFASELQALKQVPQARLEIDRDALFLYLRHGYVPAPYSIYRGIHKLPPGTLLRLDVAALAGELPAPQAYWSAAAIAEQGVRAPLADSPEALTEQLDQRLRGAVGLRMEADVPLGAFLSGGIDSSTVVALMQAQSAQPVRTFSIGFHEPGFNEAEHAAAVARHLGTDHTEFYVRPQDALDVISRLPSLYSEPFADASQIPTFLVCLLARQHVTVALSGDGGDELFAGYNRYSWGIRTWGALSRLPQPLRRLGAVAVRSLSPDAWDRLFAVGSPLLPKSRRMPYPGDRLHKLVGLFDARSQEELYRMLISQWQSPAEALRGEVAEPASWLSVRERWPRLGGYRDWMQFMDLVSYLPDDILVKVDRASMGVSLEARVPLLDHELVEFAWRLPAEVKVRDGQGKWLLRQVLYRYVPRELIERPKVGFALPIDRWLRGPLRDWAEALLDPQRLEQGGCFQVEPIRRKWQEHLSGRRNWQYPLWMILMFQAWLREQ